MNALVLALATEQAVNANAFQVSQEMHVNEVSLYFLLFLFMYNVIITINRTFVIENWLGGCPNACSGHGSCATLGDITLYQGITQNLSTSYSNWDKSSITVCNCDDGYFGADCSLGIFNFIFNYVTLNQIIFHSVRNIM